MAGIPEVPVEVSWRPASDPLLITVADPAFGDTLDLGLPSYGATLTELPLVSALLPY